MQERIGLVVYGSATSGGRAFYVRFHFILDKPEIVGSRQWEVGS